MLTALLLFMFLSGCPKPKQPLVDERPVLDLPSEEVPPPVAEQVNIPPALEKQPDAPSPKVALKFEKIQFEFDAYELNESALFSLQRNAAVMQAYPDVQIRIEGHCDERGTIEYNLALGDKRARACKEYLTSLGIGSYRIMTISYGKERPVDYGQNELSWSRNRRAEFIIQ